MDDRYHNEQSRSVHSPQLVSLGVASPPDGLALRLAEALVDGVNYEPFPETERLPQGHLRYLLSLFPCIISITMAGTKPMNFLAPALFSNPISSTRHRNTVKAPKVLELSSRRRLAQPKPKGRSPDEVTRIDESLASERDDTLVDSIFLSRELKEVQSFLAELAGTVVRDLRNSIRKSLTQMKEHLPNIEDESAAEQVQHAIQSAEKGLTSEDHASLTESKDVAEWGATYAIKQTAATEVTEIPQQPTPKFEEIDSDSLSTEPTRKKFWTMHVPRTVAVTTIFGVAVEAIAKLLDLGPELFLGIGMILGAVAGIFGGILWSERQFIRAQSTTTRNVRRAPQSRKQGAPRSREDDEDEKTRKIDEGSTKSACGSKASSGGTPMQAEIDREKFLKRHNLPG